MSARLKMIVIEAILIRGLRVLLVCFLLVGIFGVTLWFYGEYGRVVALIFNFGAFAIWSAVLAYLKRRSIIGGFLCGAVCGVAGLAMVAAWQAGKKQAGTNLH